MDEETLSYSQLILKIFFSCLVGWLDKLEVLTYGDA